MTKRQHVEVVARHIFIISRREKRASGFESYFDRQA